MLLFITVLVNIYELRHQYYVIVALVVAQRVVFVATCEYIWVTLLQPMAVTHRLQTRRRHRLLRYQHASLVTSLPYGLQLHIGPPCRCRPRAVRMCL